MALNNLHGSRRTFLQIVAASSAAAGAGSLVGAQEHDAEEGDDTDEEEADPYEGIPTAGDFPAGETIGLQKVAEGLPAPTDFEYVEGGDENRHFIVAQTGQIYAHDAESDGEDEDDPGGPDDEDEGVDDGAVENEETDDAEDDDDGDDAEDDDDGDDAEHDVATPEDMDLFLDLEERMIDIGIARLGDYDERGLLNVAFHPDYEEERTFYVRYSAPAEEAELVDVPEGYDHVDVLSEFLVGDAADDSTDGNETEPEVEGEGDDADETEADTRIELGGEVDGWIGQSGDLDGETNPTLELEAGTTYEIVWENLDGAEHELIIEDEEGEELEESDSSEETGETVTLEVEATEEMAEYYCGYHPDSMRGEIDVSDVGEDGGADADGVEDDGTDDAEVDLDSERRIMEIPQPQDNHNGGQLAFDDEGYLLTSVGDGGGTHDNDPGHVDDWYDENEGGNAQDTQRSLLGGIHRIAIEPRDDAAEAGADQEDDEDADDADDEDQQEDGMDEEDDGADADEDEEGATQNVGEDENGDEDEEGATQNVGEDEADDAEDDAGADSDALEPGEIVLGGITEGWVARDPEGIADEENPTLTLQEGESYTITWENVDAAPHNVALWNENEEVVADYQTEILTEEGAVQSLEFEAREEIVEYVCEVHPNTMTGAVELAGAEAVEDEEEPEDLEGDVEVPDVDAYSIPEDNPLVGTEHVEEYYAWGFRNPWGMSIDEDGQVFVADAGQHAVESLYTVEQGGNYSWNVKEGSFCFSPETPVDPPEDCPDEVDADVPDPRGGEPLRDPIAEYQHRRKTLGFVDSSVVTGGHRYEGDAIEELQGEFVFANWSSEGIAQADGELLVATDPDADRNGETTGDEDDGETNGDVDEDANGDEDDATVRVRSVSEYDEILVGPDGLTLYVFDQDTQGEGESACYDECAENWPPLTVEDEPVAGDDVDAELSTFEREDGSTQVTADGWPLYYFAPDEEPGDVEGQGVNDVWWVLAPDGTPIESDGDDLVEVDERWDLAELQVANADDASINRYVYGIERDEDGELYVLANTDFRPFAETGEIYRIVPEDEGEEVPEPEDPETVDPEEAGEAETDRGDGGAGSENASEENAGA